MSLAAKLSMVNAMVKEGQREINTMPTAFPHEFATDSQRDSQQEPEGAGAWFRDRSSVGSTGDLAAAR